MVLEVHRKASHFMGMLLVNFFSVSIWGSNLEKIGPSESPWKGLHPCLEKLIQENTKRTPLALLLLVKFLFSDNPKRISGFRLVLATNSGSNWKSLRI